jgi:hypothetical protein
MTHNIDYQDFADDTVIPLHGAGFVRRDAAWRMDVSDAFAESLQIEPRRLTLGERLVRWFRFQAFAIGVALYGLAVSVACYFAFELGRGLL